MSLERRQSYRIIYPQAARPVLEREGRSYAVADVSEHGLRFEVPADGEQILLGDDVEGTVRFRSGPELRIEGTVVRIAEGWVALRLAERLPFAAILGEQRFLRMKYPMWGREE